MLQININIVDYSLDISFGEIQLTFLVKNVGLVSEDGEDQLPVNRLSAPCDEL